MIEGGLSGVLGGRRMLPFGTWKDLNPNQYLCGRERALRECTCEVADAFVGAVVFPAGLVVPFHTEPGATCAGDVTYVSDGTQSAVVGQSLSYCMSFGHLVASHW